MTTCPACGSKKLEEIGPGEYKCRSSVEVATGAHPSGAQGPSTRWVICGEKFFDPDFVGSGAKTGSTCKCGTYSVGRCRECGTELCGQHSQIIEGGRLCERCQVKRKTLLAEKASQEKASREVEIRKADVDLADVVDAFVSKMKSVPTTKVVLRSNSRLERRTHLRFADSYHRVGKEVGQGWYVDMPNAQEIVTHIDTSAAGTETSQRPGLGVLEDGSIWKCTAHYEILAFDELEGTRDLAVMTHGVSRTAYSDPGLATDEIVGVLSDQLNKAARSPWGPAPFKTRREEKADREAIYKWRDEQIYGEGGLKGYRERMYGPETFWDKVKKWIG